MTRRINIQGLCRIMLPLQLINQIRMRVSKPRARRHWAQNCRLKNSSCTTARHPCRCSRSSPRLHAPRRKWEWEWESALDLPRVALQQHLSLVFSPPVNNTMRLAISTWLCRTPWEQREPGGKLGQGRWVSTLSKAQQISRVRPLTHLTISHFRIFIKLVCFSSVGGGGEDREKQATGTPE